MINIKLDHKDPKRLQSEFIKPLIEWVNEHNGPYIWSDVVTGNEGLVAGYISLWPSYVRQIGLGSAVEYFSLSFLKGDICLLKSEIVTQPNTTTVSWSDGARATMWLILRIMEHELQQPEKLETFKKVLESNLQSI